MTTLKSTWNSVKAKIQDAYPDLTEEDVRYEDGREEELLENLQNKTGKDRPALLVWIDQLSRVSM